MIWVCESAERLIRIEADRWFDARKLAWLHFGGDVPPNVHLAAAAAGKPLFEIENGRFRKRRGRSWGPWERL